MSTLPRTRQHFPRMKLRGKRRRHERRLFSQTNLTNLFGDFADLVSSTAQATGMHADQMARAINEMVQAYQGSVRALERDPYLVALNREEPPAEVTCPVWFLWSAFGGRGDTQCDPVSGYLLDTDEYDITTTPCPMHQPAEFYEWAWGGSYIVPTCARCERMLPTGTPLQMHELGTSLSASAECGTCGKRTWVLMRNYADALGDETPQWHPGERASAVTQ
ncbi:hypothetical protein [Frigoribacterium sp. VKM Ac-2530]|uniref:hypothetical protein n=1 Tax=Frigoribacterium sp. VKM Ac-2530 TaxID=2783822 RepID=UPI00188C6CFC|nr:hypothetical protein [Frigoribacterium sp. VKM Ac-2530]MBF4578923.1 hypothetical protein [Frigoribacterium sp. VKM Ac-2530]